MNSFTQPFLDGLAVLGENWQLVLVIVSVILVGHFAIHSGMKSIFGNRLEAAEYFSLGMAGWLLPACLLSVFWYVLRISLFPQLNGGILILLPALLGVILFFPVNQRTHESIAKRSKGIITCLLAFLCISIPLRLVFISEVLLPLYFDSTRHYAIINSILGSAGSTSSSAGLAWLMTDYYHVGFHFLAAWITSILDVDISQTMLVLGQMIVAVTPLSAFFLIKHETRSNSAGFFAVLLAGFGWSMPAYALNWGKYPAVTSLALLPFVLSAAYLTAQSSIELTKQKKWTLYTLLACVVVICVFLHSRSLVVIVIAVLAWIIASWWQALPERSQRLLLCALLLGILSGGIYIQRQEVFAPLFNPYLSRGIFITAIVLFLSIFAQRVYPKLTFANLVAIFLLLSALFIPTPSLIPRLADRTLLDRPLVEMLLYLLLSFLGGLGLAGLAQTLRPLQTDVGIRRILREEYLVILFTTLLIGAAILQYDLDPSDCCIIAGRDDLRAMNWIRSNIPDDAKILISADELMVSSSDEPEGYAPADAGAWITPLTGRSTVPMLYDTNLDKEQKFEALCKMGVDYIYIGGVGLSFHAPRIASNSDWYKAVFSISRVEVYQVIGCH